MEEQLTIPITRTAPPSQKVESKYPTESIDLPSEGYFYPASHPLSSGTLEVKMMTAKEEDILTNANYIKKNIMLDKLLEAVIIDKSIKSGDLLVGDLNAVIIALRRLAYGDQYGPLTIRCEACKQDNTNVTLNLGDIKTKEFDFTPYKKNVNEFDFELPRGKKTVTIRLLTSRNEADISDEIQLNTKLKIPAGKQTALFRHTIIAINGDSDKGKIRKFVDEELTSSDSLALRTFIHSITPNLDIQLSFKCSHCDSDERTGLPMTAQFFWPDPAR